MSFFSDQIDIIRAQILFYNDAITFLIKNPTKSYTLDTGQSRQSVIRQDLESLIKQRNILFGELDVMSARVDGTGTTVARPGW